MSSASASNSTGGEREDLAGLRVLVVEDAWHVAKALKSALEGFGMIVAGPIARIVDAEQFLIDEMPDLALVDVNLKGEMAYGLIDRLVEKRIPVVVVSGYAVLPRSVDKAAAVLQKPFSGAQLLATLRHAMQMSKNS